MMLDKISVIMEKRRNPKHTKRYITLDKLIKKDSKKWLTGISEEIESLEEKHDTLI